jgi:Flp pilus assembly protein protease CpaA
MLLRSLLTLFVLAVVGGGDGVLLASIAASHRLVLLVQQRLISLIIRSLHHRFAADF